jgi:prepilin-type N-terminal cleavage/methylation domain-containing protein
MKKLLKNYFFSKGFSLIEVLVSLQILGLAVLGLSHAFAFNITINSQSDAKAGAAMAVSQYLDTIRSSDISTLPMTGNVISTINIGKRSYLVTATFCTNSTYCNLNSVRQVKVNAKLRGKLQYEAETVFSQLQ